MKSAIRPGGLILLEGYRPEQVDYGTGGPPRRENMYTREWLESQFSDWDIVELSTYDAVIHEGHGHSGLSALIDLMARKPAVDLPSAASRCAIALPGVSGLGKQSPPVTGNAPRRRSIGRFVSRNGGVPRGYHHQSRRIGSLMDRLRLGALSRQLDESRLQPVNVTLQAAGSC